MKTFKNLLNFTLVIIGIPIIIFLLFNLVYLLFHPDTKINDLIRVSVYNIIAFLIVVPPLYFLNQKKDKLNFFRKLLRERGWENWSKLLEQDFPNDRDDLTNREFRVLGEEIYTYFFHKFLENFELLPDELEELEKIQSYFTLGTEFLERLKKGHGQKVLEQLSRIAYEDTVLTIEEEKKLYSLAAVLNVSREEVQNLNKNAALGRFDEAIQVVLEDNRYNDEEIREIEEMQKKLNISAEELNLKGVQKQLDYFRTLHLIENDKIPEIQSSTVFSGKEKVYWEKEAVRLEFRPSEKFLETRGFVVKLSKGEKYQIGKARKPLLEPTGKGRFEGKLFLTSHRIIFIQKVRPFWLKYSDLLEVEIFRNGICLYDTKKNSALLEFSNEDELFPFLVSKLWK